MMKSKKYTNLKLIENIVNVPNLIFISNEEFINNEMIHSHHWQSVSEKIEELDKNKRYAIRSAGIGEDEKFKFAGIFESYLNIEKQNIYEYIGKVYQSFNSKKSQIAQKISKQKVIPGMIIQEMIIAQKSAVIFSNKKEYQIDIINDKCEEIVNGKNNVQEINILKKSNKIIEDKIINDLIIEMKKLEKIEEFKNKELDVETVFDGNKWWIIQVR